MRKISLAEFEQLSKDATILQQDEAGIRLLQTADHHMIRFFRAARSWPHSWMRSPAQRFVDNAERLNDYSILCADVEQVLYCPKKQLHLVIYPQLEGRTLSALFSASLATLPLMHQYAEFIARLHFKSIDSHRLQLNNVIMTPEGRFALMDVTDIKFCLFPMGPYSRLQSFKHIFGHTDDREIFKTFGLKRFIKSYLLKSRMSPLLARIFLRRFLQQYDDSQPDKPHEKAI
ncbi:MAG: hypothetical protein KZQ58_11700 [gamma proteobacterium symbiont of Bathyaustriella thionipta]|nr:hypothetical protein [gamma proteobacterium symbiont of Bathyaustriella thionipta]